jgi:hypothetical protein
MIIDLTNEEMAMLHSILNHMNEEGYDNDLITSIHGKVMADQSWRANQ